MDGSWTRASTIRLRGCAVRRKDVSPGFSERRRQHKLDQMADAVAEALPQVQPLTPGPAVDQLRGELGVLVQFLERRAPGKLSQRGISG